jgi:hypothetical protein
MPVAGSDIHVFCSQVWKERGDIPFKRPQACPAAAIEKDRETMSYKKELRNFNSDLCHIPPRTHMR